MADTAVAITAGSGTNIDTRTESTNGNHRQVVCLGDPDTNAGIAPVDSVRGITVQQAGQGAATKVSFTRPNNTTAYAANDIVGATTAALEFASMGASGGCIEIVRAEILIEATAIISGESTYQLALYGVTPPSAAADNAAFDVASGDRASFLGLLPLGAPLDLGSTLYIDSMFGERQFKLTGTSLFAYLVTTGAYTPTANRVYNITLHTRRV
jgi:hypothetical protein